MNPSINPNSPSELPEERPFERPIVRAETARPSSGRAFLFKYVTTLVTGLLLLTLVSVMGYVLLDHWMNKPEGINPFSSFVYSLNLYLVVTLVLTAGLHIWMRLRIKAGQDHPSAGVFQAIFLTILALTILSALGAIVYMLVDMMLGTANYESSELWVNVIGATLTIVWSVLLWWHFKAEQLGASVVYAGAAGAVAVLVAALLVGFPISSQRDAVVDARTSGDLTVITTAVEKYTSENNKLPGGLAEVTIDDKRVSSRLSAYEYSVTETEQTESQEQNSFFSEDFLRSNSAETFSYKLCATFRTDTSKEEGSAGIPFFSTPSETSVHPKGKHCFDMTAYGKEESSTEGADSNASNPFMMMEQDSSQQSL